MMVRAPSAALHLCGAPFGEKPVDPGATQARDAKQGPPRCEGIVPLPELRSDSREGGRRTAPQGEVTYSTQQIHHIEHALGHIHQLEALVHGGLA